MKRLLGLLLVCCGTMAAANAADTVLLWPNGAPGALGNDDSDKPSLTIYLPPKDKALATGVVICPGGGYQGLATEKEGTMIAQWFNSIGVAGFVLKYRLGPRYHHPIELGDAQRAIRYVRAHAAEYGISPDRIGIMGFSAGGHLASTAETHFDKGEASAADPLDRLSDRPDFAILCYPVVQMAGPYVHQGSRRMLLGDEPDPKLEQLLSNDQQVTPDTPPTFLFHTNADTTVPVVNSVEFYLALKKNNVPAEMHIFEDGPHGVGLAPTYAALSIWPTLLGNWLRARGLLDQVAH